MEYYAYLWLRKDGTPYYVGKGSGKRAFTNAGHVCHRPIDAARILILNRASEADAFATEIELIRNWGRKDIGTGCLQNHTDGGENPPNWKGRKRGAEFSRKLAQRNREHPPSEETKEKIRVIRTGTHWTQASRDKMSKTRTGVPYSPSHLAAAQRAHKNCKCPTHVRTRNLAREVQEDELRG